MVGRFLYGVASTMCHYLTGVENTGTTIKPKEYAEKKCTKRFRNEK